MAAAVEVKGRVTFDGLIERLQEILEEDGDVADIDAIKEAMDSYTSTEADWEKFVHWDDHTYTRNLVCNGNGKYNLMLLCWNLGQHSSIHAHAGSHCFMKCLDGALHEELYDMPETDEPCGKMDPCKVSPLETNGTCYISDEVGLHRISNQSHTVPAISLHLYSPPYETCKSYCELSGEARCSAKMTFYSKEGVKVPTLEQ
eukprot:m.18433 g.18433  ORF g.18433 m.18433 type:complete len:201 (+) comp9653_c0_seq1:72-674(+)